MNKGKLIIWDCDGVLVDSEWIGARAFTDIINELGGQLTVSEVYHSLKGGDIYKSIQFVKEQVTIRDDAEIVTRYRKLSSELFEKELKQVSGVEKVLSSTTKHRCVASNGPRIKIFENLRITGLMKYFEPHTIFSGHDIQSFKPEPHLFLMAAELMGTNPDSCIVIEDSLHGANAASAAGMFCFGYCAETEPEAFSALGATPFHSMDELLQYLM